jgi:type I restriction enzyme S subunit
MNAEWLFSHFARISEAPDAIPRLRRFILDLAVRGKLVKQDPKDEPAAELLKRIQATRKIGDRKGRQHYAPSPVKKSELPFRVPASWDVTRLAEITVCLDHLRVPVNSEEREQRISGRPRPELFPYFGATQQQGWIDDYIFDEPLLLLGEDGVPFFDGLRPKSYLISGKTWVNNHAHVFRGVSVSLTYLKHYLDTFDYRGRIAGATRTKLNQAKALDIPVILPPLAEQHRITAKVAELMALCDHLETAREEREHRRERLGTAALRCLSQPADDGLATVRNNASFYLRHLPRLTTRPEQVRELRQTILDLAIQGRLVRQDPRDEPAAKLLQRIRETKGLQKSNKQTGELEEIAMQVDIPEGWELVRARDLLVFITSGSRGWAPYYSKEGSLFLRIGNLNYGKIDLDLSQVQRVNPPKGAEGERTRVQEGDILISITGDTGMVALIPAGFPTAYINQHIALVRPSPNIYSRYLAIFFTSPWALAQMRGSQRGVKNSLGLEDIRGVAVSLPPFPEQHRIVAKVNELMALCDHLEAKLLANQTAARDLIETALHEALASF